MDPAACGCDGHEAREAGGTLKPEIASPGRHQAWGERGVCPHTLPTTVGKEVKRGQIGIR